MALGGNASRHELAPTSVSVIRRKYRSSTFETILSRRPSRNNAHYVSVAFGLRREIVNFRSVMARN